MKFFIEGEKSKAICDDCKELVAENYQRFKHIVGMLFHPL